MFRVPLKPGIVPNSIRYILGLFLHMLTCDEVSSVIRHSTWLTTVTNKIEHEHSLDNKRYVNVASLCGTTLPCGLPVTPRRRRA